MVNAWKTVQGLLESGEHRLEMAYPVRPVQAPADDSLCGSGSKTLIMTVNQTSLALVAELSRSLALICPAIAGPHKPTVETELSVAAHWLAV